MEGHLSDWITTLHVIPTGTWDPLTTLESPQLLGEALGRIVTHCNA